MSQSKQIMDKAISYIGTKESPRNSNNVIFNTHYYGKAVSGSAYPWCCAFVWDIFRMCGLSDLFYDGKKTAYCPSVYSWAKKKNLIVDKKSARYADIVLFDFKKQGEPHHIGFIERYDSKTGVYHTIEGNTSTSSNANGGCVMRRQRSASQILAIVRPKYSDKDKVTTTTTTDDKATTTTSTTTKDLKKGSKGEDVKTLQKDLNKIMNSGLSADGDFGGKTQNAVIAFQRKYGLKDDGVVGAKTFAKLADVLKQINATPYNKVDAPKSFDFKYDKKFKATTDVHLRAGAGTDKYAYCVVSMRDEVSCDGYYTSLDGTKWYYVYYTKKLNGNVEKYNGFVSGKCLK